MISKLAKIGLGLLFSILLVPSVARGQLGATVSDWPHPTSQTPSHRGAITTMGDVTNPLTFIGVTPCRIVDTRGPAGTFGGPSLAAGVARSFPLQSGPCTGLPTGVEAYSLNITATNTLGPGFIKIYPEGTTAPLVSTLNYVAGQTIANAAIVPATGGGVTVVAGVSGTDLIIDIDGYFTATFNDNAALSLIGNRSFYGVLTAFNSNIQGWGVEGGNGTGSFEFVLGMTGVFGVGLSSGTAFGVQGITSSTSGGSAGVLGIDGSGSPGIPAGLSSGVFGLSSGGYGVWGVSKAVGVKGTLLDSGGNPVTSGYLGHDDINGVYAVGNIAATGAKTFIEPHPAKAGAAIVYVALEGPEAGTYFRGRGRIHDGTGVIAVPESFRLVSSEESLTVQVTPIGEAANVAVVSADLNSIVVQSPRRELEFYYFVNGVRKSFEGWDPMAQPDYFVPDRPDERMTSALTAEQRRRLIANGTYNPDGTVNMRTAERMGWTKIWADREARAKAAAQDTASSGLGVARIP